MTQAGLAGTNHHDDAHFMKLEVLFLRPSLPWLLNLLLPKLPARHLRRRPMPLTRTGTLVSFGMLRRLEDSIDPSNRRKALVHVQNINDEISTFQNLPEPHTVAQFTTLMTQISVLVLEAAAELLTAENLAFPAHRIVSELGNDVDSLNADVISRQGSHPLEEKLALGTELRSESLLKICCN